MKREKYRYNPATLSYELEKRGGINRVNRWSRYLGVSIILSTIIATAIVKFLNNQNNRELVHENERLLQQYELLNKDMDNITKVLKDIQERDDNIYRVIFETEPISKSVRDAGFGGVNRYRHLNDISSSELVIETSKKMDILSKQMYIQTKSYDEVLKLALSKERMIMHIPSIRPIASTKVVSGWSWRVHPIYKTKMFHYGLDFTAPKGTEVYATGDGVVKEAKKLRTGWGYHIKLDHEYSYMTVYAHLSKFNVKRGDKVKRGDIIGYTGSTGTSSGPHLHYEVRKNGTPVNPMYYFIRDLSTEEYRDMISTINEREAIDFEESQELIDQINS